MCGPTVMWLHLTYSEVPRFLTESSSLDCFEPTQIIGGGMLDHHHEIGIEIHSALGSSVSSRSGGHHSGFRGSLSAEVYISHVGDRGVIGIGASVAGILSLG